MPGTDIGIPKRRIWVVTTAALPWMTGTSVNPLLRAAYLTRGRDPGKVRKDGVPRPSTHVRRFFWPFRFLHCPTCLFYPSSNLMYSLSLSLSLSAPGEINRHWQVSLMIPWLSLEDQDFVLPEGRRYETKREQESYIRDWLRGAGMTSEADDLGIAWYDARYHQVRYLLWYFFSIFVTK